MAEKVTTGVEIEVGVKGDASVKSIKTELRQATAEAASLAVKFGENSKEAITAAKRVAGLRDIIDDTNRRIQAFDPGPFQRIATLSQGIAAGFSAAQGAAALFGLEGENIEKQMLKVQGAIALSTGLHALADLSKQLAAVGSVIVNKVITAFTTLRGALIATGIGAIGIALGAIVANFDKISAKAVQLVPVLGRLGEVWDRVKQVAMGTFAGIVEGLRGIGAIVYDLVTLNFSGALAEASTFGQNVAKAYGEGVQGEQAKQEKARTDVALAAHIATLEKRLEIDKAYQRNTYALELQIFNDKLKLYAKDTDEYQKALVGKIALQTEHNKELQRLNAERLANSTAALTFEEIKEKESVVKRGVVRAELIPINANIIQRIKDDIILSVDEELQRQKQLHDAKVSIAASGFAALAQLTTAFAGSSEKQQRRAFEVNKALQTAQTIIETYSSAVGAYRSQLTIPSPDAPVRAAIAAGVAIASGLARVAMIQKTQFNTSSIAGAPVFSTPNISAPSIGGTNTLAAASRATGQTGDEGQQGKDIKVYVLEHDISQAQRKGNRLSGAGRVR